MILLKKAPDAKRHRGPFLRTDRGERQDQRATPHRWRIFLCAQKYLGDSCSGCCGCSAFLGSSVCPAKACRRYDSGGYKRQSGLSRCAVRAFAARPGTAFAFVTDGPNALFFRWIRRRDDTVDRLFWAASDELRAVEWAKNGGGFFRQGGGCCGDFLRLSCQKMLKWG